MLKCIFKKRDGGMERIAVAQGMDKWCALVNAVTKFLVPYNAGNFLASW